MVEIVYDPIGTLVVHDVSKIPFEDLMRERVTPGATMPLYWCSGILFSFASPPMTDEVTKEYFEGKIHWMEVHYSEMKDYKPVLELNDEHYGGAVKVRAIDTSGSQLHKDFTAWLKKVRKM
ncbi:MAG TPA: hypothetical protein VL944_00820 [Candidatus Acidoferrum sp.]|nr:hypothetical protein [Candidatus Acidoferrum sp.]